MDGFELNDGSGNVTARAEYSTSGSTTSRTGTTDTPFWFNGRYGVQTDANGILYMRARYYNPYLCRFLNPDPVGFSGGVNFYAYADGNPISSLDPSGEYVWVIAGAIIGAAIDGGLDFTMQMRSGEPIDWYSVGATTTRGAIVGTVSSLAGPTAGTMVKGAGGLATGLGAKVVSTGISAAGSAGGQMTYNAIQGNALSDGMGSAALFGAGGQVVANAFPVKGVSTLAQANYFAPQSLPSMFASQNSKMLTASIFASSAVGAGSYFMPQAEPVHASVFNSSVISTPSANPGGMNRGILK
ncbi:MAG: RHS repeat-associated core domain-containing protein [bacterium]